LTLTERTTHTRYPLTRCGPTCVWQVLRQDDVDANELIEKEIEERREIEEQQQQIEKASEREAAFAASMGVRRRKSAGTISDSAKLLEMRESIREHLIASEVEVIVVVEGIDPASSNTFQARHSYMSSDIVFDAGFAPTMSVAEDGKPFLDWRNFHQCVDVPFNTKQMVCSSHS
jgi:hypothetical protein